MWYKVRRCDIDGDGLDTVTLLTTGLFGTALQHLIDRAAKCHPDDVKWDDRVVGFILTLEIKTNRNVTWLYAIERGQD